MTGIDASMFELFREEVKAHADTLAAGLIAAETNATDPAQLESLMRAAHSIKGAARIVGIDTAVRLAHVMEDALVAAQEGKIRLGASDIDAHNIRRRCLGRMRGRLSAHPRDPQRDAWTPPADQPGSEGPP